MERITGAGAAAVLMLAMLAGCGKSPDKAADAGAPAAASPAPAAQPAPPDAAKPAEAPKPAEAAKPADAPKPADAAKPADAPKPAADAAPAPAAADAKPVEAKPADAPKGAGAGDKPYQVVDGVKVDPHTMDGFRTWRSAACDRCHGANQEGMVGPSLIESLKKLSKDDFKKTLTEGRLEKGMPAWNTNKQVMDHLDDLYAYLKGRSDGAITKAHVEPM